MDHGIGWHLAALASVGWQVAATNTSAPAMLSTRVIRGGGTGECRMVGDRRECDTARMGTRQLALYAIAAVLGAIAIVAFITAVTKANVVNPYMPPVGAWQSGSAWGFLGAGAAVVGVLVLGMGLAVHAIADELAMVRSAERVSR